jgi:hypothetical protein
VSNEKTGEPREENKENNINVLSNTYIMSLYIHPENQELLWKITNKNPQIASYFSNYPPNVQETWFKQIISSFYEQNRQNVNNSDQLYEINKNTLSYMVQDVKRNIERLTEQQQPVGLPNMPRPNNPIMRETPPSAMQSDFLKPYSVTENKEDKFTGQYNQYQQNYQSMFDKKVPDSIDFREKVVDGPLPGNMEDLVQRHLRERDEELQRYAPQPFFGGQLPAKEPSNRLTIDPSPENVKLAVEEIAPPPIYRNEPEKKVASVDHTVKWLDNENSDKIRSLEQEVAILKNQVLQMSDKISLLINANKDIFDFSAQRLRMNNATIRGGFLFDPSST